MESVGIGNLEVVLTSLVAEHRLYGEGWRDIRVECHFKDRLLQRIGVTFFWRRTRGGQGPQIGDPAGGPLLPRGLMDKVMQLVEVQATLAVIFDFKDGVLVKAWRPGLDEEIT